MRAVFLIFPLLAACGARTGLELDRPDAGFDAPIGCLRDFECDDRIDCTTDRCVAGVCASSGDDLRCDDSLYCTGVERCMLGTGCVSPGMPCADAVECTDDTCDEALDACVHDPNVDRCPISHRCDADLGCVARALVHADDRLFEIDLPSGASHFVSTTDVRLTDLALHPDGRLFAIDGSSFFFMDYASGSSMFIASLPGRPVALEVGPGGFFYTAGDNGIARVDPASGVSERFATFPPPFTASGDIAFVEGRMLVTATDDPSSRTTPNDLFEVPLEGGVARRVGTIGSPCIWGVAPFGTTLYGFTCRGELLVIDVTTGAGTVLRDDLRLEIGGAAAR